MKKTLIVLTILLSIIIVIVIFFKDYIPGIPSNKTQTQPTKESIHEDTGNPKDTNNSNTNNQPNNEDQNIKDIPLTQNNTNSEKTSLINKDLSVASTTPQSPQIQNQKQSDGNQKDVVVAVSKQLYKKNLQFFGTVVVYPYALQDWSDDYIGGVALLKHNESGVWFLLNAGGGTVDYQTLIKLNINPYTAIDLINGLNK